MKNNHKLVSILALFLLSACLGQEAINSTKIPTQDNTNHPSPLPTESLSSWCINLRQEGGLPIGDTSKNSHIISLGSSLEAGSSSDQIWAVSLSDGSEKLLLDNIPSPFLGLAFLPDAYHFILVGSQVMQADLDSSVLESIDDIDKVVADFRPFSPIWNLLSDSPKARDARFGILYSPNGMYSAMWKLGDPALLILDKRNGRTVEIIQTKPPDRIGGGNWSPDGNFFVFTFYKNANPNYTQVYMVNADGSELRPLSQPFELEMLNRPRWSPDGQKIAIPLLGKDGWYHIVIINHSTGEVKRFRVSPIIRMNSIEDQGEMAWSPDSKWFAYISQSGHYGIEILNVESGEIYCSKNNEKLAINMIDWR